MAYTNITINYSEGTLCEEISFVEPGEQKYSLGENILLSDYRLYRDRHMIVKTVNYTENESGGLSTTVSGFSEEYKYTRKSPNCDISFLTMTEEDNKIYQIQNPYPDSKVYIRFGDIYGVGGWSMHSIVEKIAIEWMGLNITNNLPNFWISDFTISIGSTFFESLVGLISEFEPIIVLEYGTLYILERNGAGALNSGQITLAGTPNRTVDREYNPVPGCIRVEGGEGRYRADKDPMQPLYTYFIWPNEAEEDGTPEFLNRQLTETSSGTIKIPEKVGEFDSTTKQIVENYSIVDKYYTDMYGDKWAKISRVFTCKLYIPSDGEVEILQCKTRITSSTVYYRKTLNFEYSSPVICSEQVLCEAMTGVTIEGMAIWTKYNIITTQYTHDQEDWTLKEQTTSKSELFVYDYESFTYNPYDPRDYNLENLLDTEETRLEMVETRTTTYSMLNEDSYAVDTIITSFKYVEDEEIWKPFYTFEHDIVEAGGQQRAVTPPLDDSVAIPAARSSGTLRTMQVYSGTCPETSVLSVVEEPVRIFNIPTPDWDDIEDCYVYLSALVAYEFQRVGANTPLIDPLPLMSITGLGSIIQSEIIGSNYVKGYTINIDANSGYSTDLELEARRA